MTGNLKCDLDELIARHGHAAIIKEMMARVLWQSRWAGACESEIIAPAIEALRKAAVILDNIEKDEEELRLFESCLSGPCP